MPEQYPPYPVGIAERSGRPIQLGLLHEQAPAVVDAMMADTWLTKSQVATRLGVHRATVERMITSGVLTCIRLETGNSRLRHIRISESELERYLRARSAS